MVISWAARSSQSFTTYLMIQVLHPLISLGRMQVCRTYRQCERVTQFKVQSEPFKLYCVTSIHHTNGYHTQVKQTIIPFAARTQYLFPRALELQRVSRFNPVLHSLGTRSPAHFLTFPHRSGISLWKHPKRGAQGDRVKIFSTSHNLIWVGILISQLWIWKHSSLSILPLTHRLPSRIVAMPRKN